MKIAIVGYGKMGRSVERIALKEKIEIVSIIDKNKECNEVHLILKKN